MQTVRREGFAGLYRGMMSPLIGVTPMFALSFWSYDVGQRLVYAATPKRTSKDLTMLEYALAGGFSAIPTTIVTTPMERVKVVLQTQGTDGTARKYNGMLDAGRAMYREGGLGSLYRGTVATLARDVPGSAAYFVAYEWVYRWLKGDGDSVSVGAAVFAGGMAGVAMWSIAIPPDVVKSRIQAAPAGTYKGFMDCATRMVAQEGPQSLFKGLGPALLRAFPANAAAFAGRAIALEGMHRLW
ncbi:carnitine transporter [Cladochytrium tenue]|nr:carnitine transporter [Cladochytrium tenue]